MSHGRGVTASWDLDGNAAKRMVVDAIPKINPSGSFRRLAHGKLRALGTAAMVFRIFPIEKASDFIRRITPLPVVMTESNTCDVSVPYSGP